METVLTGAASVFSIGSTHSRTWRLKERLEATKRHLEMRRFWRDKHNARRFVDAKEEEIRAIGSASAFLAGFTSVVLFQLAVPSSLSDQFVCVYAATGALTCAIFGYCVILHVYLLITLYGRANVLRRNVQVERDAAMDLKDKHVQAQARAQATDDATPQVVEEEEEVIEETEDVNDFTRDGLGHREERELWRWWGRGCSPYAEDMHPANHASMGAEFHGMFSAFKWGTACFVMLFVQLCWIQGMEHKDHLAYSLVCFFIALLCVYAFLRGIYWTSVDQLEASYRADSNVDLE